MVFFSFLFFCSQGNTELRFCAHIHPGAVVAHGAASGQTGVEVGDAVGAAHGSVLVDPAAAVDVAAARQIPVSHRQRRAAEAQRGTKSTRALEERPEEKLQTQPVLAIGGIFI